MKTLVTVVMMVAVAAAQPVEPEAPQFTLRDFIQHLMSLEQRQQGVPQEDEVLVSNAGVPLLEVPSEGVYELYEDPSDVVYVRDNGNNYVGGSYNYDKVESPGKSSYLTRPKRQAQAPAAQQGSNNNNNNRLTQFVENVNQLTSNLRRQTSDSLRNIFRGQAPNPFRLNAAPAAAPAASGVTSLNDVYGSVIGARKTKRDVSQQRQEPRLHNDPFADLFRPLHEIFSIVNATARAVFKDVLPGGAPPSPTSGLFKTAVSERHEFKLDGASAVVETETKNSSEGPVAKIHMTETFYDPEKKRYETVSHDESVLVPAIPFPFQLPFLDGSARPSSGPSSTAGAHHHQQHQHPLDPARFGETLERIALPFQRAFVNFTTELGMSFVRAMHPGVLGGTKAPSSLETAADKADKPAVTLDFYRPDRNRNKKKDKPLAASFGTINEENVYPPKTETNVVPDGSEKP